MNEWVEVIELSHLAKECVTTETATQNLSQATVNASLGILNRGSIFRQPIISR